MNDEFCSDSDYHEENTSEKFVEEIVIKPDSETNWKNADVKDVIEYKLKIVGINVIEVEIDKSESYDFISCFVKIQPTLLKNLDIPGLPFRNLNLKFYHPSHFVTNSSAIYTIYFYNCVKK